MTEASSTKPVQARQIGWMTVVVACVVTAMISIGTSMWLMRDVGAGGRQHIVFVDARKIIDAKAIELAGRKLSESENAVEGAKFAAALQTMVAEYQSKGLTVINGAALLSESDESDLTSEVAKRMGVQLDAKALGDGLEVK